VLYREASIGREARVPKKGAAVSPNRIPATRLGRIVREIRRRRIIETAAAFIGGGWVLLEFVHWILIDHYHFPEHLLDVTFVTILCALLCTLAWRWFRTPGNKPRGMKPELVLIPLFIAFALFLDVRLFLKPDGSRVEKAESSPWLNSIAVMPFADLSPAKDQEYFCEGMAEDIRTKLTRLNPRLKVIARYAMMTYKDAPKPIGEIAHELGVATILEGSVQKEGDRIRVNAQLINAGTGAHVWADLYNKTVASVFDLQDEISLAIVKSLELKLAPGAENALSAGRPENLEAYEYFLKAQYIINTVYALTSREEDFVRALEMIRKAIELDPKYARAYAGLSWAYNEYYTFSGRPEYLVLVLENAKKALDLDPNQPESQAAGGYYYLEHGDLDRAFDCLRRALALNPNAMEILHTIGLSSQRLGLHHQAIKFLLRALELSPGNPFVLGNLAISYLCLGDIADAEAYFHKVMTIFPGHPTYVCEYADLLIRTARLAEAGTVLDNAGRINLGSNQRQFPRYKALLAATLGDREAALAIDRSPEILARVGLTDDAVRQLQDILRLSPLVRNYSYLDLINNPYLKSLGGHPRFQAIVASQKVVYEDLLKKYGNL
jgi:TolB-like protein/Flp pilus assembly protein TadD